MVQPVQVRSLAGHSDCVVSVSLSPDGTRIVTGSSDKLVKIWDAETGAEVVVLPFYLFFFTFDTDPGSPLN